MAVETFIKIVLGMLVLLILAFGIVTVSRMFNEGSGECLGVCEAKCTGLRLKTNDKCIKSGVVEEGICCASLADLIKRKAEKDDNTGTGGTGAKDPIIEVRLGNSPDKIKKVTYVSLYHGETYNFHMWGEGTGAKTCSAEVLEFSTNEHTNDPGMTDTLNKVQCVGEQNRKAVTFKPTADSDFKYKFVVYLYDDKNVQIASEIITFTVLAEPNPRGPDIICQYNSCTELSIVACGFNVPNCPLMHCKKMYNPDGSYKGCATTAVTV